MKPRASCCKKYSRKSKACKKCPLVLALGCKRKSKKVRRALKRQKLAA